MKWTKKEVSILIDNFDGHSLREISDMLPRRSYNAVAKKSRLLGFKKYNKKVKYISNSGYYIVRKDDYPKERQGIFSKVKDAIYVYEHYYILWKEYPELTVESSQILHHKNGIKTDNRIENLEILFRSDHSRMHNYNREIEMEEDEWIPWEDPSIFEKHEEKYVYS